MTEIFTICDAYTVFRDGTFIEDGLIKDISRKHLVSKIIGRDYQDQFPEAKAEITAGTCASRQEFFDSAES